MAVLLPDKFIKCLSKDTNNNQYLELRPDSHMSSPTAKQKKKTLDQKKK